MKLKSNSNQYRSSINCNFTKPPCSYIKQSVSTLERLYDQSDKQPPRNKVKARLHKASALINKQKLCSIVFFKAVQMFDYEFYKCLRAGKICFEQQQWSYTANNLRWFVEWFQPWGTFQGNSKQFELLGQKFWRRLVIYSSVCKERKTVLYCCKLS